MAEPSEVNTVVISVERKLKQTMIKVMEAEQRTRLLLRLLKLGLTTQQVKYFNLKQKNVRM